MRVDSQRARIPLKYKIDLIECEIHGAKAAIARSLIRLKVATSSPCRFAKDDIQVPARQAQ